MEVRGSRCTQRRWHFSDFRKMHFSRRFFPCAYNGNEFSIIVWILLYWSPFFRKEPPAPVTTLWATAGQPLGYPQYHFPTIAKPTPAPTPASTSVKHEHYHYHYDNWDGSNGVNSKQPPSTSTYVYSPPLRVSNPSTYKNQYRGDPYRKRANDDQPYFPIEDDTSDTQVSDRSDKNSRKLPNT